MEDAPNPNQSFHTPRWRKNHPKAANPIRKNKTPTTASVMDLYEFPCRCFSYLRSDLGWLWGKATSWTVAVWIVGVLWLFGGLAVSDHLYGLAYVLFTAGGVVLLVKFWQWVFVERAAGKRAISLIVGSLAICGLIYGEWKITEYFQSMHLSANSEVQTAPVSSEPQDRANLHVVQVEFKNKVPSDDTLKSFSKYRADLFPLLQMTLPKPEAIITYNNIGKYRIDHYAVRTAVIISPRLAPDEEGKLFAKRPEWQTGGDVGMGSLWYVNEPKKIHTHYGEMYTASDWPDLIAGKKVFYVVTKAFFTDFLGSLPRTESCTWWSIENRVQRSGWCWTHNT